MMWLFSPDFWFYAFWILMIVVAVLVIPSIRIIGPTEVGLVTKRFSLKKLPDDNPIAFHGEAGYQADLLMPGWRFKLWVVYAVEKFPWVQVRAGEIGVVVAQVGKPLPVGAKSAESMSPLNMITDLHAWLHAGGQKGVQRPVLPPGSLMPVHPVGFLGDHAGAGLRDAGGQAVPALEVLRQVVLLVLWIGRRAAPGDGHYAPLLPRRRRGRHLRHRHDVGRPAAAGRRHRQPAGRVRRRQEAGNRRTPPTRPSSKPSSA